MTIEPAQLAEQGKQAFRNKQFDESAELFRQAAEGFSLGRNGLLAAEMKNNMSVALLQAGKAQESLDAALGTDLVFAGAKDIKSQGMALGNQAAALEALNRFDEAIAAYERSAELFAEVGEGRMSEVRHEFINSRPDEFDSNCAVCGGKKRDWVHGSGSLTGAIANIKANGVGTSSPLLELTEKKP